VTGGARDFEDTLDALRRWTGERRFQVGVQLLRHGLDPARAGAAIADIAETGLAALLPAVEAEFARQHGAIAGGAFAIVAMGRLGSREMSLASDLDLILIYDAPDPAAVSDGPRPLPVATYYARLSQRLIGAITAPTAEGRLYEVDMRLRPSGEAGPIASSLAAFARYQQESAWTWEHMALTRARPIAGGPALCRQVESMVYAVLVRPRDPARLVVDVDDMHRRIAEQHSNPAAWDVKNRRGGLVDIQFIVQYLLLREAAAAPAILHRALVEALPVLAAAGALPQAALPVLLEAVSLFQRVELLATLLFETPSEAPGLPDAVAATLARGTGAIDSARVAADITAAAAAVGAWYETLVAEPARQAAQLSIGDEAAMSVKPGDKAPDFTLPTDGNGSVTLSKLKGKKVVLYFYPKDDTTGCTAEACGFRDAVPDYGKIDAVVIGLSKDSVASHDKFKKKYELPFILASDVSGEVCERYGVWVEKSLYGRKYMGIDRSTFLIDEKGVVRGAWNKVRVPGHVAAVLAAAQAL